MIRSSISEVTMPIYI